MTLIAKLGTRKSFRPKQASRLQSDVFFAFLETTVRLRITERLTGSIDGIQLDRFVVGQVYEVGHSLGSYLLSTGAAEPVPEDSLAVVLPLDQVMFGPVVIGRSYQVPLRDQAADRAKKPDSDPT